MVVLPAVKPVTFPDPSTDALVLLVVQVPPAAVSLIVIEVPTHSEVRPWTGVGDKFTVIDCVVIPQLAVT